MTIQSGTNQSTGMPETADYKMLYQQLKIKHQFMLSQVSHEIRNPVTLINSFMQLLEGRHPELTQDNYWQKIMENMDFLKSLLNELSAFNNSGNLGIPGPVFHEHSYDHGSSDTDASAYDHHVYHFPG